MEEETLGLEGVEGAAGGGGGCILKIAIAKGAVQFSYITSFLFRANHRVQS